MEFDAQGLSDPSLHSEKRQSTAPTVPPVANSPALPPLKVPAVNELNTTRERPLFEPSRRVRSEKLEQPLPNVAEPARSDAPFVGQFKLSAVVLVASGIRKAIVRNPKTGVSERISPGETIAGWKLVSVSKDEIRLQWGSQIQDVRLRVFGKSNSGNETANLSSGSRRTTRALPPSHDVIAMRSRRVEALRRQWRKRKAAADFERNPDGPTGQ